MAAFTAVAAGVGMAISAGSAGMSFAQAGKQRNLQKQAENDAALALAEARKRTEVNYYEQLGINKEPYALEREALLVQGATGMQAAMEGDERGVAAAAGRIQAAQNQAQQQVTSAMGTEMSGLNKLVAQEDSRLRDINLNLDIGSIQGAQQAASDAGKAAAAATTAGFTSLASAGKQALEAAPLYARQDALPPAPAPYTGIPTKAAVNATAPVASFDMNKILAPYRPAPQPLNQPYSGPFLQNPVPNQPFTNYNPFNY